MVEVLILTHRELLEMQKKIVTVQVSRLLKWFKEGNLTQNNNFFFLRQAKLKRPNDREQTQ